MKPFGKNKFMDFAVSYPEGGDTAAMQKMLDAYPEHEQELLWGERKGVSDGNYSAWLYSTWLCQFLGYRDKARPVVKWLLAKGHQPDIWSMLALEDTRALRKILKAYPERSRAEHHLFGDTALEMATPKMRKVLLEFGADDGSIA